MLLAGTSPTHTILLTPIIFGLAHVHHFYEFRLTHPRVPATAALVRSAFQFAYTTLFGAYATFLFLRTGSLAAVCAVHAFCNCMGLPQVWGRVEPPSAAEGSMSAPGPVMAGGDVGEGEGGGERRAGGGSSSSRRPSILWTVTYYVLLVAGAVVWYRNLWVLSESGNALVPSEAFGRATA
jgi:prenyl protein peptidase